MGIKETLQTEKGKITAGVLAAVLGTTAIMVPMTIAIDRSVHGQHLASIQTYGYDGSVTSTGARQDTWMGIDGEDATDMNMTLLSNQNYHGNDTPQKLIDGVDSSDGLSYLSHATVMQQKQLRELGIYDKETGDLIEPTDSTYPTQAPLNMNMKVPKDVANVLREHLISQPSSALTISDLDEKADGYGTWLKSNGYINDFAFAFLLFNYTAYSSSAKESLANAGLTSVNDCTYTDEQFKTWIDATFIGDFEINGKSVDLLIDGTGTDEVAIEAVMKALNKLLESYNATIMPGLNDGGSYRAWETTDASHLAPGTDYNPDEYDGTNNGTPNAFIGTQSRGFDELDKDGNVYSGTIDGDKPTSKSEIAYWGYDPNAYKNLEYDINMDNVKYDLADFTTGETANELPLSTTIAGDSIVFFTTADQKVNGKEVIGITQEGYRLAFEAGVTWEQLDLLGDLKYA